MNIVSGKICESEMSGDDDDKRYQQFQHRNNTGSTY
jgi:hypothetical protein